MTLTDEAKALVRPRGLPCFFEGMDDALADEIRAALTDSTISCNAISAALQKRGLDISGDSLRRHRAGRCIRCRS